MINQHTVFVRGKKPPHHCKSHQRHQSLSRSFLWFPLVWLEFPYVQPEIRVNWLNWLGTPATFSNFLGLPAIPARAGHRSSGTLPLHRILPRKFRSVADNKNGKAMEGMEPTGQSSSFWKLLEPTSLSLWFKKCKLFHVVWSDILQFSWKMRFKAAWQHVFPYEFGELTTSLIQLNVWVHPCKNLPSSKPSYVINRGFHNYGY